MEGERVRVVDDGSDHEPEQWNPARNRWVAAAAAAAVALAVALLVVNLRSTEEPPTDPLEALPAPITTTTTTFALLTAPPVVDLRDLPAPPVVEARDLRAIYPERNLPGWSRVRDVDGVFSRAAGVRMMSDVIVAGPGFVAVGNDSVDDGREGRDAAVWTSVDGSVWSRVPHDQTVFGDASMSSVVASGNVIVAVGGFEQRDPDRSPAIVWTSLDGMSWSRVADGERVFGDASMTDVTVGGPGFVAVGSKHGDAAVWTSVDGQSWSQVAHDESVFGGSDGAGINSVTAGGPGLVAVGDRNGSGAAWTSTDGLVWSRVSHDESVFPEPEPQTGGTSMHSVTAGGPGLVAVGRGDCRPVWTSVDGFVWSRVPEDVPGTCEHGMNSVIVDGERLLAVGGGGVSWSSVDGITWTVRPDDATSWWDLGQHVRRMHSGRSMNSVTSSNAGLVAVGFVGDPDSWHDAAVWLQE